MLGSLPKHTDRESNPADDPVEDQEISKKEQGRMKARRAREAVALKRASEVPIGDTANLAADERDAKKSKSDP